MQSSKLRLFIRSVSCNNAFTGTRATSSNSSDVKLDNLKSWKEIPGPKISPLRSILVNLTGVTYELQSLDTPGQFLKLLETYGPIVKLDGQLGMKPIIALADPEMSATILRSENQAPIRLGFYSMEYYRKKYKVCKGQAGRSTGLLTEHGDLWKEFRSAVNPVLLQPRNIKLYSTVLDEVAIDMIKRIRRNRDENYMFRDTFNSEMKLWSFESIGVVALGCRLNCLNSDLPEDSMEKKLIQCVHDTMDAANDLDFKPSLWKYISTPTYRKAMKLYEYLEVLIRYFIKNAIEQIKLNANQNSNHEKGILEKLLDINEDYAYIMASDLLFGGIDANSNTSISLLYFLAKNQDKQDKLREEILSKCSKRSYLKACVKEVLRIMPPVSGNTRQTTKEYNLMGYKIPKGMLIAFLHHEMSLMEHHFPRAQEFLPERWLVDKTDPLYYGNSHPFAYAPFGFGVRTCIGRRLSEIQIETLIARVIENFKVEWIGPSPKIERRAVNYIKGPFNFTFKDVN